MQSSCHARLPSILQHHWHLEVFLGQAFAFWSVTGRFTFLDAVKKPPTWRKAGGVDTLGWYGFLETSH